jgi:hypothetical protein
MTRAAILKRLAIVEETTQKRQIARIRAEMRTITAGRVEELMRGQDDAYRKGRGEEFFVALSAAEQARLSEGWEQWIQARATEISREHLEGLAAAGVPLERFTDSELLAVCRIYGDEKGEVK